MAIVTIVNGDLFTRMAMRYDMMLDQAMRQMMSDYLLEVVRSTNMGLNYKGDPFLPYSAGYTAKRVAEGRSIKPNMQYTSSMLSSLTITSLTRTTSLKKYKLGVSGSDRDGVSNSAKLADLKTRKNYIILAKSKKYEKLVTEHLTRFLTRFSREVF